MKKWENMNCLLIADDMMEELMPLLNPDWYCEEAEEEEAEEMEEDVFTEEEFEDDEEDYTQVHVFFGEEGLEITVGKEDLTEEEYAQIMEIARRNLNNEEIAVLIRTGKPARSVFGF